MVIEQLMLHVEALVFASDKPLTQTELTDLVKNALESDELVPAQISASIEAIKEKYDSEFFPFELKEIGGGYQFLTKKDYHPTILQLNGDKFIKKLSTAALETLAIIAYRQPITKPEIEYIRGVSCDYSVQKLLEKDLIMISGRNEEMVGKPLTYTVSKSFMDYFGLNSMDELPKLREVFPDDIVMPTDAMEAIPEDPGRLLVTEDGELLEAMDELPSEEQGDTPPEPEA